MDTDFFAGGMLCLLYAAAGKVVKKNNVKHTIAIY
jgi:hypothetical protein